MESRLSSLAFLAAIISLTTAATIAPPLPASTAATAATTADDCDDYNTDECWSKPDEDCFGIYEPWSRAHCPLRCGFCPGKLPPCEDKLSYCQQFENNTCVEDQYRIWARTNCRKHCNLCGVPVPPSTTPSDGSASTATPGQGQGQGTTPTAASPATPERPNNPGQGAIPGTVAVGKQTSLVIQGPASDVLGTCQYNGKSYKEGERWKEGCEYECTCMSASQNRVLCVEQCNKWEVTNGLTGCRLVREGADCCDRLECD